MDYYNRFDYGIAGGLEVYPFKGLLDRRPLQYEPGHPQQRSDHDQSHYAPRVDAKNNAFSLLAGYKF